MSVTIETQNGVAWATATGRFSLDDCATALKHVCDVASESNAPRILVDCLRAEADLKDQERYLLGSSLAEYYLGKAVLFRIAILGHSPTTNGFAIEAASHLGLTVQKFTELHDALEWLGMDLLKL